MTKVMGMRRRTFQFCHRAHILFYNFPEAIFTGAMPDQVAFTLQLCDRALPLPLRNAQCSGKTFAVSSPQRRVRMQRLERGGRAGILTNFKRQTASLPSPEREEHTHHSSFIPPLMRLICQIRKKFSPGSGCQPVLRFSSPRRSSTVFHPGIISCRLFYTVRSLPV